MNARALVLVLVAPLCLGAAHSRRPKASATVDAEDLGAIAASFVRLEKWDQAIALLDEARATHGDDDDLLEALIDACQRSSRCAPRRLALIREGLDKLPRSDELIESLARELSRLGRTPQLLGELARHLQRHPDDDDARAAYIDAAEAQHRADLALKELPRHLARQPRDVDARVLYVELLRGAHKVDQADRQLELVERDFADDVRVVVLRGQIALDRGDLGGAEAELARGRALAAARKDGEAAAHLAELEHDIVETRHEQYADFRSEAAWLDAAEDLQREQDRAH